MVTGKGRILKNRKLARSHSHVYQKEIPSDQVEIFSNQMLLRSEITRQKSQRYRDLAKQKVRNLEISVNEGKVRNIEIQDEFDRLEEENKFLRMKLNFLQCLIISLASNSVENHTTDIIHIPPETWAQIDRF